MSRLANQRPALEVRTEVNSEKKAPLLGRLDSLRVLEASESGMTRLIHDQFAKDYLEELLSPFGAVQQARPVLAEVREIDVWFSPHPDTVPDPALGLLTQFMLTPAIFEIYRNPVTEEQIGDCLAKFFEVKRDGIRHARREKTSTDPGQIPTVWIITPTASDGLLQGYGADPDPGWPEGIYPLASALRTLIVVVHQLPRTPETLWLRLLGRGRVQQQAIDEVEVLPATSPYRWIVLELLSNLRVNLELENESDPEDRELVMRLSPLYQQRLQAATQSGIERGARAERVRMITSLLQLRHGSLDEDLSRRIPTLATMSPEEYTSFILQVSREDLIAQVPVMDPDRSES